MKIKNKVIGQASVEYLVVLAAIFLAFTVPVPNFNNVGETEISGNEFTIINGNAPKATRQPTVVEWLANVLKRNYEAYSYGIAVSELPRGPDE